MTTFTHKHGETTLLLKCFLWLDFLNLKGLKEICPIDVQNSLKINVHSAGERLVEACGVGK